MRAVTHTTRGEWAPLSELLTAAGIGTWQWDPDAGLVQWDATTESLYGIEPGSFGGTLDAYVALLHPDDAGDALSLIQSIAERGGMYTIRHRVVWPDGTVRWLEGQGRIETGSDGKPKDGYGIVYDVTERSTRSTLEREREELRRREAQAVEASHASRDALDFLIDAGDALAGSLNTRRVAQRLARTLTSGFADFCIVDVRLDEPHGWLLSCTADSRSASAVLHEDDPMRMPHSALRLVMADRDPSFAKLDDTHIDVDTPELAAALPADSHTLIGEALISRGATIGAVIAGRSERQWSAADADLLRAIAKRAAVALDQAELYRDRSAIARMFQQSMSPNEIPAIEGLDVAALYLPATELVRLGGDFYDVFAMRGAAWSLSVGDVCGKGVVAAGHAGLARAALRAAAHAADQPADALLVLNRTLLAEPSRPLLTMALAQLRRTPAGGWRVTVANGGHPPPLVVRRSGGIDPIEAKGTLLGYVHDPDLTMDTATLEPGDALVMYSDGVIESRRGRQLFGFERLKDALRLVAGSPAGAITDSVGATLDAWTAEAPRDDLVLLVAKAHDAG